MLLRRKETVRPWQSPPLPDLLSALFQCSPVTNTRTNLFEAKIVDRKSAGRGAVGMGEHYRLCCCGGDSRVLLPVAVGTRQDL